MYTTSIYKFMTNPLRDQRRKRKNVACPLPVTTWCTAEGIKKLRSLHAPAEEHAGDIMRVESTRIGSSPDLDFGWQGAETADAPANSTSRSAAPAVPMHDANPARAVSGGIEQQTVTWMACTEMRLARRDFGLTWWELRLASRRLLRFPVMTLRGRIQPRLIQTAFLHCGGACGIPR